MEHPVSKNTRSLHPGVKLRNVETIRYSIVGNSSGQISLGLSISATPRKHISPRRKSNSNSLETVYYRSF